MTAHNTGTLFKYVVQVHDKEQQEFAEALVKQVPIRVCPVVLADKEGVMECPGTIGKKMQTRRVVTLHSVYPEARRDELPKMLLAPNRERATHGLQSYHRL